MRRPDPGRRHAYQPATIPPGARTSATPPAADGEAAITPPDCTVTVTPLHEGSKRRNTGALEASTTRGQSAARATTAISTAVSWPQTCWAGSRAGVPRSGHRNWP